MVISSKFLKFPRRRLLFFKCRTFLSSKPVETMMTTSLELHGYTCMLWCPGIAIGHIYFFLEDVFPQQPGGFKMIRTPGIL